MLKRMNNDAIDEVVSKWHSERPDLDATSLEVVGRILRMSGILERRANEALKEFELPIWGFDVLGTLRRSGKPFSLTPTALWRSCMLSSGTMTNRIDRLEAHGLVERRPDPNDRRSLHVRLTKKGLKVIDEATVVRFQEADDAISRLSSREVLLLAKLLKKMSAGIEQFDPD